MKKVFVSESVKNIDAATMQLENIPSIKLMDRAAKAFSLCFQKLYSTKYKLLIVCGPGNNGGDGLAIARLLYESKYDVTVLAVQSSNYSKDYLLQAERLLKTTVPFIHISQLSDDIVQQIKNCDVIIDALFGNGINRIPADLYAELIQNINASDKDIVSVDLPSGLSESHLPALLHSIKATHTITFQVNKLCLILDENIPFCGRVHTVDIGLSEEAIQSEKCFANLMEWNDISSFFTTKATYQNKWHNGHAVIAAGSAAKAGAALLCAEAALHSGCGMLTAVIPSQLQTAFNCRLPEVMIHADLHQHILTNIPLFPYADAYAIGCGINTSELTQQAVWQFLVQCNKPLVIDADALNILSLSNPNYTLPKNCILTPHYKEFDRLTKPHTSHKERLETLQQFCKKYRCTVILKATHSAICNEEGELFFCNYPSAALGKAGTGDVLTGIIVSLLAQGHSALQSCQIALHLLMYAGLYVEKKYSAHFSSATTLINALPKAIKKLSATL